MTLIYSFLFCGLVCLIGQIIMDNTNLTPGHITSMFTVLGAILGCFGIYDKIIEKVGEGASLLIITFGNSLTKCVYLGYLKEGILGLFGNMLSGASLAIASTVVISATITLFTRARD
jgi:stage V sporulation protein AE